MKWVNRGRPKIDRIACPWLIARFIDKEPELLYVPASDLLGVASDTGDQLQSRRELPDGMALGQSPYGLNVRGQGIGSKLMKAALAELQRLGGACCVVLGTEVQTP